MEQFPTVEALAAATPAAVLRAWQGLGYDRRALALWRTARIVVDEHGGRIPSTVAELQALPGIGPYTARAVAALAFGMPVGAVDVNVRRVLGRIVAGDAVALSAPALQDVADDAVPPDRPGDWTHALMDVGAILCRPRAPRCDACPARPWCRLASRGAARRAGARRRSPPGAPRPPTIPLRRDEPLAPRPDPRSAARGAGRGLGRPRRRDRDPRPRAGPGRRRRHGRRRCPRDPDRPRARTRRFERACPWPDPSSPVGYAWLAMSSTSLPAGDRRAPRPMRRARRPLPANDPLDLRDGPARAADAAGPTGPRCRPSAPRR